MKKIFFTLILSFSTSLIAQRTITKNFDLYQNAANNIIASEGNFPLVDSGIIGSWSCYYDELEQPTDESNENFMKMGSMLKIDAILISYRELEQLPLIYVNNSLSNDNFMALLENFPSYVNNNFSWKLRNSDTTDIYTRYKSNPKLIFHADDPEIDKLISPYLEIGYSLLSARYRLYKLISSGIDPQYDNINRLKKRPSEIIIDGMETNRIEFIIEDTQKNSGLLQLDIDEKGRILSKIDMGRVKDIGSSIRGSDGIVYSTVVNDWKIRKLYYDYQKSKGEEPLEIKNDEVEKFIIDFYGKNDELTEAVNSSLLRGIKAKIDEEIAIDTGLDYVSKQPTVGPISVGQGAIKFVNNLLMSFKEGVYSGLGLSDKDFDFDLVRKTAENISMINSAFPDIKVPKEKVENNIDTQLTRIIDLETKKRANFNSYITEVLPEVMGHSFGFFWEGAVELATLAKLGKSFKPLKFVSKLEQWGEKLQKLSPTFGELYRTARESKGVIKSLGYAIGKHTPTYLKRALQVTGQSYITQTFKGLLDYYDIPDEDEKWLYDIFINRQGKFILLALLIRSINLLIKKVF